MAEAASPLQSDLLLAFRSAVRAKIERDLAAEAGVCAARRSEVLAKLPPALAAARSRGLLSRAWLFGSYAWGSPGEMSDVDVLFEGTGDAITVASLLARQIGKEVHAVPLDKAPASLRERALGEGIPL